MSSFDNYIQLLNKIDRFVSDVRRRYPASFRCAPGCSKCCVAGITVWRVEADRIKEAVIARSDSDVAIPCTSPLPWRERVRERGNTDQVTLPLPPPIKGGGGAHCPLLDSDGRCSIYDVRPVVCRLWGAPLLIPRGREAEWGLRDSASARSQRGSIISCDLNFTGSPSLAELAEQDVLNVETALTALAAINHVYCRAAGLDTGERVALSSIA